MEQWKGAELRAEWLHPQPLLRAPLSVPRVQPLRRQEQPFASLIGPCSFRTGSLVANPWCSPCLPQTTRPARPRIPVRSPRARKSPSK